MTETNINTEKHSLLFSTDSRILTFCIMTPENPEKPSESSENKRLREKFVKEISQYGFQYAEMTDTGLKNAQNFYLFLNASFENVSFCADHFAPDFIFGVRKNLTSDFTVAYYKRNRIGKYCKADSGGIIYTKFIKQREFDEKLKALREKNRKFEESRREEAMKQRKSRTAQDSQKEKQ